MRSAAENGSGNKALPSCDFLLAPSTCSDRSEATFRASSEIHQRLSNSKAAFEVSRKRKKLARLYEVDLPHRLLTRVNRIFNRSLPLLPFTNPICDVYEWSDPNLVLLARKPDHELLVDLRLDESAALTVLRQNSLHLNGLAVRR